MTKQRRSIDNARWPDRTRTERQANRRQRLNEIAHAAGFHSWQKLETAALRGEIEIVQKNPTAIIL